MNIRSCILIIALFSCFSCTSSHTRITQTKSENQSVIQNMVLNRKFTIAVSSIDSRRPIDLQPGFELAVLVDTVDSYLPYFGQAFNAAYGRDDALVFRAPLKEYRVAHGKNDSYVVRFHAPFGAGSATFVIRIFGNKTAYVTVSPYGKNTISYRGRIK